jgi:hypothetical protein
MNISPKTRVAPSLGPVIVRTVAEHQVSVLLDDTMAIELFRHDEVSPEGGTDSARTLVAFDRTKDDKVEGLRCELAEFKGPSPRGS